eukprot:1958798-Lingulodinium_polyedra.AAC.1
MDEIKSNPEEELEKGVHNLQVERQRAKRFIEAGFCARAWLPGAGPKVPGQEQREVGASLSSSGFPEWIT